VLIFVFARISYGLMRAILAEFPPVPNAHSDVETARPSSADARTEQSAARASSVAVAALAPTATRESGGPSGPEPTRFGDWERNGRCIDF